MQIDWDVPIGMDDGVVLRADVFRPSSGKHPVILTLNYSNCPMLCSLQLNGLVEGLRNIDRTIGRDFELLTISLDPAEDPTRLAAMKERYVSQYLAGRNAGPAQLEETRRGWHFAHGSEATIKAITGSFSQKER